MVFGVSHTTLQKNNPKQKERCCITPMLGSQQRDNNNNNFPPSFLCTELTDISRKKRKIGTGDKDLPLFKPPSYVTFGSASLCHRLFLFPSLLVSALLIPVRTFHRFRLKDSPTFHFKTYKERQNYRYTVQSM